MEFLLDMIFTVFVAVLLSFLVALVMARNHGDSLRPESEEKSGSDVNKDIIMEELLFWPKMDARRSETEKRVGFVEGTVESVDRFGEEAVQLAEVQKTAMSIDEVGTESHGSAAEAESESVESRENELDKGIMQREVGSGDLICDRNERVEVEKSGDVVSVKPEEASVLESESKAISEEKMEELDIEEDDDWEGIEKSELEKAFAAAAKFVEESEEAAGIGNNVKMELYGLLKIATEGSCREPQPMALMLSARAKWNAWQKLGNMSPDVAMEQYLELVSKEVPGWVEGSSPVKSRREMATSGILIPDSSSLELPTALSMKDSKNYAEEGYMSEASSVDTMAKDQ